MTSTYGAAASDTRRTDQPADAWGSTLAARLFAIPPRWGWKSAEPPPSTEPAPPPTPEPELGSRPVWIEPPRPDAGQVRRNRSAAITRLTLRIALLAFLAIAARVYWSTIEDQRGRLDTSQAKIATAAIGIVALLILLSLLRALGLVISTGRAVRNFEQPYLLLRSSERQRYVAAAAEWDAAMRARKQATASTSKPTKPTTRGPQWYPVLPATEPRRVDVLGGDTQRHGWAGLLVTVGSGALAAGRHVTVLDLTGQDVASGLLGVAQARSMTTSRIDLPMDGPQVNFLGSIARRDIPECLSYVFTGRREAGDLRVERALIAEAMAIVVGCLDGTVTFGRLAAGINVLRSAAPADVLSDEEAARLADRVGDLGSDEWTMRQLRFLASQLTMLDEPVWRAGGAEPGRLLWSGAQVSVVAGSGGRDDRRELQDRLIVQLAQHALQDGGRFAGLLVVAGADQLGAAALERLSDHARQAGVQLMVMIDQPQGDLERIAGTGGAVCVMKMYNHRDAAMAADFIGREHKFVVSQVTAQLGRSFADGGGDNFSAASNQSTNSKSGLLRETGRRGGVGESRGHTWTGARTWTATQNTSDSTATSRVYEFAVEPQQILGMPETAFIMVDNTGAARRVVMADSFPGICLFDGVSPTPAAG